VAFRENEHVGTRIAQVFAAQWLAYALPCRRFAVTLTDDCARLGAGAGRYSFTVVDLHLLLLAGFSGAPKVLSSGGWRVITAANERLVDTMTRQFPHPGATGVEIRPDVGVDQIGLAASDRGFDRVSQIAGAINPQLTQRSSA
jgi:hypothetical protein